MTTNYHIANIYSSSSGDDCDDVDDIIETVHTNVQIETSNINNIVDYREEYFRLLKENQQKNTKINQLKNAANARETELAENNKLNCIKMEQLEEKYWELQKKYLMMYNCKNQIEQGYELTLNQYRITNNNNLFTIRQLTEENERYKSYICGLKNIPTKSENITKSKIFKNLSKSKFFC